MDAWSVQALVFFMALLPGFLTRAIVGALTAKKQIGDLASIIESCVFSIFVYIVIFLIKPDLFSELLQCFQYYYPNRIMLAVPPVLYFSFGIAFILGLLWSYTVNFDIVFKFLRKMKATTSTARGSVWLDVFYDMRKRYVIITLDDNRRIFGYPRHFSNNQGEDCIFLTNAEWLDEKNKTYIPLDVLGVLIIKKQGIKRIEFLWNETAKGSRI